MATNVDPGGGEAVVDLEGAMASIAQALNENVTKMTALTEDIVKVIENNFTSLKNVSEQFATKQDTGTDEEQAGHRATSGGNGVAIANLVNNNYAHHANIAATRSQTYHDQLMAISNMHIANQGLNAQLATALHVLDSHQQCAANSKNRGMVKD